MRAPYLRQIVDPLPAILVSLSQTLRRQLRAYGDAAPAEAVTIAAQVAATSGELRERMDQLMLEPFVGGLADLQARAHALLDAAEVDAAEPDARCLQALRIIVAGIDQLAS